MSNESKLFFKTFGKFMISGGLIMIALIIFYIISIMFSAVSQDIDVDSYIMNYSGQIYYMDSASGNYKELDRVYSKENRVWVSIMDMPKHLKDAAVAIEDERFYKHKGVDLKRTIGATIYYIIDKDKAYGGSTITQQLVKNLTGQDDRSIPRKIKEIINSFRLERKLSKDQILELYLNTIYLSQGCNGVGAAAEMYFNKEVGELTIAESAAIVGITQYPTRYDPFLNPEKNKTKQELVLKKMLELGSITEEEYQNAVNAPLNFARSNMNTGENFNSYFIDQLITDVANDLVKYKKYDKEAAMKLIHTGGIKIYSTINPDIQRTVDRIYTNSANFGGNNEQSAITIIDPYTGEVKAMSGGVGKKRGDFVLNRATMTLRQPGSSIKPISVYAPAIEFGEITPNTVMNDSPISIGGWSPSNSSNKHYGNISIGQAVKTSNNIVAVKVLQKLGVNKSYDFLTKKLGITTLVGSRNVNGNIVSDKNLPALALGGLTDGVSTLEMAAAYATFANDGLYIEPHTYLKVTDTNGKVILEKDPKTVAAMSENTARIMTQLLIGVTQSGGTGTSAALSNMVTAGKTGTTDNNKDKWFVGYTPYYVGAVWFGCDDPRDMSYISGNPAARTWKMVMEEVHRNLPGKSFVGAESLPTVEVEICSVTGLLYSEGCVDEHGNPSNKMQVFYSSDAPRSKCSPEKHKEEPESFEMVFGDNYNEIFPDNEASLIEKVQEIEENVVNTPENTEYNNIPATEPNLETDLQVPTVEEIQNAA